MSSLASRSIRVSFSLGLAPHVAHLREPLCRVRARDRRGGLRRTHRKRGQRQDHRAAHRRAGRHQDGRRHDLADLSAGRRERRREQPRDPARHAGHDRPADARRLDHGAREGRGDPRRDVRAASLRDHRRLHRSRQRRRHDEHLRVVTDLRRPAGGRHGGRRAADAELFVERSEGERAGRHHDLGPDGGAGRLRRLAELRQGGGRPVGDVPPVEGRRTWATRARSRSR